MSVPRKTVIRIPGLYVPKHRQSSRIALNETLDVGSVKTRDSSDNSGSIATLPRVLFGPAPVADVLVVECSRGHLE